MTTPETTTNAKIRTLLREKTHPFHEGMEKHMTVMSPSIKLEEYQHLLETFYGFYAPLERNLKPWQNNGELQSLQMDNRQRTPWLVRDLKAIGLSDEAIAALPQCNDLPSVETLPQVWGCLYVVEGSTLGGQMIKKHLKEALNLEPETGSAFFSSYGDEVGSMWQAFCQQLEEHAPQTEDKTQDLLDSACQTFIKLGNFMSQQASK